MTEIVRFNDSVIIIIPDISYLNGGMILGEIGNIHQFSPLQKAACICRSESVCISTW